MKKRVLVISLVLLTLLTVVLMTSCDEEGFGDIRGLSYKLKDDGTYAVDIGWSKYMPMIDIPAEYNGKPVTEVISSVGEAEYSLLKEITIPSTVTRVQLDAFAGCPIEKANVPTCAINAIRNEELKTLVINGGSIIYGGAFNECEKLKSVTIYEDVEIVENAAFWGGSVEEADIPIHALRGFSTVTLKNVTIRGEGEIPHGAFRYFNEINSITVGSGITEIADGAFQNISETVTVNVSPDNPAFMAIDNVIYTKDGTELVRYMPCKTETSFTVPSAVTKIRATAFCENRSLENVTMHDGVTEIGAYAFYKCESLKSISIPRGVTDISIGAFWRCSELKTAALPEGINVIGMNAFGECSSLENVNIPSGVTVIGDMALLKCPQLAEIKVAEDNPAFKAVDNVLYTKDGKTLVRYAPMKEGTEFSVSDNVTELFPYAFASARLKSVSLPSGLEKIGSGAFSQCLEIEKISIPEGIKRIEVGVFSGCAELSSVTLPKSLSVIGYKAFENCEKLQTLNYRGTQSEWSAVTKVEPFAVYNVVYEYDGE